MCLIAVAFRMFPDAPLIVGANREEYYQRGGTPPQLLTDPICFIAGLDPVAGGTWLGINEFGVLVAVTNRPRARIADRPPSRGLLARELLVAVSSMEAAEHAHIALSSDRYAGCNILCADRERAFVFHGTDQLDQCELAAGLHVVTARNTDDMSDPRIAYSLGFLDGAEPRDADAAVVALKRLCSDSNDPPGWPICVHRDDRGTVSSSIIVWSDRPELRQYWHTQGPPDREPYRDYSDLMKMLSGTKMQITNGKAQTSSKSQ